MLFAAEHAAKDTCRRILLLLHLCCVFSIMHVTAFAPLNFKSLTTVSEESLPNLRLVMYVSQALGAVLSPGLRTCLGRNSDIVTILSALAIGAWYIPHRLLDLNAIFVITAIARMGYGSLFVNVILTIQENAPTRMTACYFAMFCSLQGISYIMCGLLLFCFGSIEDSTSLNKVNLAMYILGALYIILHYFLRRIRPPHPVEKDLSLRPVDSRRPKILMLVHVLFMGFIVATFQVYNRCSHSGVPRYWEVAFISFAVFHVITGICCMCTYKKWHSESNPIITTIFLFFGFVIMGFTFWGRCSSYDARKSSTPYYWTLAPIAGAFLGSATALLFIEGLTLLTFVWNTSLRYSAIILCQCMWGVGGVLLPSAFELHNFFVISFCLTVLYIFSVPVIYRDVTEHDISTTTNPNTSVQAVYRSTA